MDDLSALTHQLEYIFLKKIIAGLKDKTINLINAKTYANDFLSIEPFASADDAYAKIMNFVTQHNAFTELKTYMDSYNNDKNDLEKIRKMREHMKNSDIDAALQVAKD